MDVKGVQQNLGNGLVELETGVNELTAITPQEANVQIQQSKAIIMDTQLRLSKVINDMALVEQRLNEVAVNQQQQQTQQVVNNLNQTQNLGTGAMTVNKKEIKAFNLKKTAQFGLETPAPAPTPGFGADSFDDTPELGEEQFSTEQDLIQGDNLNRSSFTDFLVDLAKDPNELFQFVKENTSIEYGERTDKLAEQFNMIIGDPARIDEVDQIAGQIYDLLNDDVKEIPSDAEFGTFTTISETNDIIKKIAEESFSKKAKSFNLKKTAQHKTQENVIMYGPKETRLDPFLRQPVSDWSIIERNKGFGLTFDDVWDIDYEAIWRGTVMDKYSRPYRDSDGNWVGGYINKRFEVDHNIPETNNLQLKPGETRRITPPEYGSTESRLQAARANGDVEGGPDVNRTKPFNWKEASSKKKS